MIEIKSISGRVLYVAKDAHLMSEAVEEAVKAGADLAGAHLAGAYLAGVNLAGAHLAGAHLAGAHLTGVNLAGAHLTGAYLAGAYLAGAHLTGVDLTGADLAGAYLAGAHLTGAHLTGVWPKVANVLRVAIKSMNDSGRHWIQGSLERELDDGSTAYCSIGSVDAAGDDGTAGTLALWLLGSVCAGDIVAFNDDPGTTWEDVRAVFAVAIRHADRFGVR